MKKWISILLVIGSITLLSGCQVDNNEPQFDINELSGDIILDFSNSTHEEPRGIYTYSLKEDTLELLLKGSFNFTHSGLVFNNDKTKILTEKNIRYYAAIIEYDLESKKVETIRDEKINYKHYYYIKYVPNSNKISYTIDDVLYIFDRDTGKETRVMKDLVYEDYSWDKNGEKLIYSYKGEVFLYDLNIMETTYLFPGSSPIYSNNNEYIAYRYGDELKIHELKIGTEWNLGYLSSFGQYVFSPDDKYISYSEEYYSKKMFSRFYERDYKIFIEDFKNGEKMLLLEGDSDIPTYDWK